MAATANPRGAVGNGNNNSNNNSNSNSNSGAQENGYGGSLPATDNSSALRHNPSPSLDWTLEEQSTLEDLLAKYTSEVNVIRYAKIAQALNDKTVRDVALRCRWMNKKENGKRRKDDHSSMRNKDKKEKVIELMPKSSPAANCTNHPTYIQSIINDSDDGISYKAIGGATGQILEQNAHALDQISANFSAFKIHENINLFHQARFNILSILNDSINLPEIMKQMPPLPVMLNEDLANSVLL